MMKVKSIKIRKKRQKKLANLLLRNYILLYFLMPLFLIIFIYITGYVIDRTGVVFLNEPPTAQQLMRTDYENIDASKVLELKGWIEVVNSEHRVVFRKGEPAVGKVDQYTDKQYYSMLLNNLETESSKEYTYSFAYNNEKNFLLVVVIPSENIEMITSSRIRPIVFILMVIMIYIVMLVLGTILYTKITSKTFLIPLNKLMESVRKVAEGDYSTRVRLKSKNEFGELRDAFNLMAEKIGEERALKEKSEETRRRLIMDISHDLKNPLASVIGYSDLLIKNPDLSEAERAKYLKVIENNGIRANNLIKDLFDFSKFESLDFKLELEDKDICEFMRALIAGYIPEMEEKQIEYDFCIPEKSIVVPFHPQNLDRAISNLILNSIKYNGPGTRMNIILEEKKEKIEIIVEDNGIGIPKEVAKNIFEPFIRVDSARNSKTGGTGLGLAITKTIIEKHGGEILLDTDSGLGCKFSIYLYKNSVL